MLTKKTNRKHTNLSDLDEVLSGRYRLISDELLINATDKILNSPCLFSVRLSNLSRLFRHPLIWPNKKQIAQYALVWGSSSIDSQIELCSYCIKNKIPIVRAEDGFLRSIDTWCNTAIDSKYTKGVSFTFSNDVYHFNATKSSCLERLINDKEFVLSQKEKVRAKKCIKYIVNNYLSKYNHQPIYVPNIGRKNVPKILVVDQAFGDWAIKKGCANKKSFQSMLKAAMDENPNADIIIKTHPDILVHNPWHSQGYFSKQDIHKHVYFLTEPINPIALIQYCDKVYACTSQLGFEGIMCGKEVHVFGMPWYAGWGLTIDNLSCARRKNKRTLAELFYAAYILYSHYFNPNTGKECEIEEAMEYLLKLRQEYFTEKTQGLF